jgi:alginate O-acetyltransferase complex protein AlgI
MVFSSEQFLFLFLPLFLLAYYLTPVVRRSWTIVAGSYVFYAWWRVDFLFLLIGTTAWTYYFGLKIQQFDGRAAAKTFCAIGVAGCLAVLGIFKYLNFFIDSFAAVAGTTPDELGVHWRLILPIGISFYVFQSISYLVDIYRKDAPATKSFIDFAAFIALFPQLIAGPILRFKDLAGQISGRVHSVAMFTDGMCRFTVGLAKKVLLADAVAPIADASFALADPTFAEAFLGMVAYSLQLYFDFSGYSDMAIGLGMMMGFRFIDNFNRPYISKSITEFWRRWHISLSVWLRDYLYIPLGGNRRGVRRTYVNLITVMVLGGLWHGASWTFVVWGAWHGCWLAVERATRWSSASHKHWFALPVTLLLVMLGWVVFRAETVPAAFTIYGGLTGLNGFALRPEYLVGLTQDSFLFLALSIAMVALEGRIADLFRDTRAPDAVGPGGQAVLSQTANLKVLASSLLLSALMVLSVAKLAEQSFSPFLYFQF